MVLSADGTTEAHVVVRVRGIVVVAVRHAKREHDGSIPRDAVSRHAFIYCGFRQTVKYLPFFAKIRGAATQRQRDKGAKG